MYMIWHKKLGLVKLLKYRWQVWLWLLKYGKDENIEIIEGKYGNKKR